MRGFRFAPLVVITAAVAIAVGVTVARQELPAALAESPGRAMYSLGGTLTTILIAAVATLPLVMLLAFLRRRPLLGRRLALGLGALLMVLSIGLLLVVGLRLGDPIRTTVTSTVFLVIGFVGYGLALNRFVRWLDERLPAKGPM